jgi:hypothetical protein
MMRELRTTAFLAMVLLMASSIVAAQGGPAATVGGQVTLSLLGREDVSSSKFSEYREISKGVSVPYLNLFAWKGDTGFTLWADNLSRSDQRYSGTASLPFVGVAFDYNQIPHNMGNDAHLIWQETSPGVWSMSSTLRQAIGSTANAKLPTSGRTYDFYNSLLAPTFSSAQPIDLTALRQRGTVTVDLGKKLPFDLAFSYMRERKSGTRGPGGGDVVSAVSSIVDVPEPLNELTQDYSIRAAYNFKMGNVHGSLHRNLYNNQAETLLIDNPFQPYDVAYNNSTTNPLGGPGTIRITNAPDNEATTGSAGFLLKFKRQTRIGGDFAMARWTQNAPFYPYTSNSTILTSSGQNASSVSSLQQSSLNGKINTGTVNVYLTSKPIEGLGVRLRYRSYDLTNKTSRWVITGDAATSPDRSWSTVSATADEPYGHATANPYDTTSKRFDASVSYDIKALTLEGSFFNNSLTRTNREAESGKDRGYGVAAVFHAHDLVDVRAFFNQAKRTAVGTTTYGFQEDEAERKMTVAGVDLEVTPVPSLGLTFAYFRRNVDYPNRPLKIASNAETTSGLLWTKYDTLTGEVDFTPNPRVELNAYYTYEKNLATNRWSTLLSGALNNLLNYEGSDKGNTFGVNGVFHVVPEQWTLTVLATSQKIDGLMGITANAAGAFYTARASLNPPGPQNIGDWDDTTLTTVGVQIDRQVGKAWKLGVGYAYEKYDFSDAYTSGTTMMPTAVYIFMKPDYGPYKVNVAYAKLTYRF